MNVEKILSDLEAKHPGEKEYLQAVKEVLLSVKDVYESTVMRPMTGTVPSFFTT